MQVTDFQLYQTPMRRELARRLRRNLTDAERHLWFRLRDRRLFGLKFRRQIPIGPFVADFICWDQSLIVELDGGQHASETVRDDRRTEWLEHHGWRVIRFWNNDVFENTDGVLWRIAEACGVNPGSPHPDPLSHAGEGEG
jgi:very-short-patch-repair endonuclease